MRTRTDRPREERYNTLLGELLRQRKLRAEAEVKQANLRTPDVKVFVKQAGTNQHWRAVECKLGQSDALALEATNQLKHHLHDAYCEAGLILLYPEDLKPYMPEMDERTDYRFAEVDANGQLGQWLTGSLTDFTNLLQNATMSGGARLANVMHDGVEEFAKGINEPTAEEMRRTLRVTYTESAKRIAGLLLVNGLILQAQLKAGHPKLSQAIRSLEQRLLEAEKQQVAIQTLIMQDWKEIQDVDYAPVVDPVIELLAAYGSHDPAPLIAAIHAAQQCAPLMHGNTLDVAGPVYHALLDSQPDGSFYTETSTSVLLSELMVRRLDVDWSKPDAISRLRICDPACGTGTLLMATRRALLERYDRNFADPAARIELQKAMMERTLTGLDINGYGLHLGACMMTLGSGNVEFNRMQLHRMAHGRNQQGITKAGSIELLMGTAETLDIAGLPTMSRQHTSTGTRVIPAKEAAPPGTFDAVIMNPPFTINRVRNDQYEMEEERLIQTREKEISDNVINPDHRDAISPTSIGTYFVPIADDLLKENTGTLAMVKPTTAYVNFSGRAERRLLCKRFHPQIVITSHDNKHINFSGKTDIHESLLFATRPLSPPPKCVFVSLRKNPTGTQTALETASAIERAIAQNDTQIDDWAMLKYVDQRTLQQTQDWYWTSFWDPRLSDAYATVIADPDLEPLSRYADVGPNPRAMFGSFTKVPGGAINSSGPHAIWDHKTDKQTTLITTPNMALKTPTAKKRQCERVWKMRGYLLIGQRWQPSTVRTPSVFVQEKTLSSAFVPVRPRGENEKGSCKAYALWLNSTPGLIQLLATRTRKLTYPMYSIESFRELRIPHKHVDHLAKEFDRITEGGNGPLEALPDIVSDPVRRSFDDAVVQVMPQLRAHLASWRELIANEPTVHGRKDEH